MRVLVTGGTSFIGGRLIAALLRRGDEVSVLVRDRHASPFTSGVTLHVGDLVRGESLSGLAGNYDAVYHLASYVHSVPRSEPERRYLLDVNVGGTANLLERLGTSTGHVVFFSSVAVYGIDTGESIDEAAPTRPTTAYGHSKLLAEGLLFDWGRGTRSMTTALRLPLVYGPGNKGNILRMIRAIDRGLFVLVGKGENRRSLLCVDNAVEAAVRVTGREKADGKVYNVTDRNDYTVKELYEVIAKGLGRRPLPFHIPLTAARAFARLGDLGGHLLPFNSAVLAKLSGSLTFSSGRLRNDIGFIPDKDIYSSIEETLDAYRNQPK